MAAHVVKFEAGQEVKFKDGNTAKVLPPCANKTNGYWYCATCKEQINTNFPPSKHERSGTHKMLWMCWEHGPEQA